MPFLPPNQQRQSTEDTEALAGSVNWALLACLCCVQMWSFGLVPSISRLFSRPNYPFHTPNTVVPLYSAAMHAKYEVLDLAIRSNPFNTRYFCWLDVGLFRDLSRTGVNGSRFTLVLPPHFERASVAYTEVARRRPELSVQEIVSRNMHWVCGCFFVGRIDSLQLFVKEYKVHVRSNT